MTNHKNPSCHIGTYGCQEAMSSSPVCDDNSTSAESDDAQLPLPAPPARDSDEDHRTAEGDNEEATPLAQEGLCASQQHYEDSGNNKKVLYMMSIGLTHNDAPLFSVDVPPWSLLPKTTLRPKNTDFGIEIDRRAALYNIHPTPRPRNWSRKLTTEWLENNPVSDARDVEFLRKEVSRVRAVLERAQQSQGTGSGNGELNMADSSGRNWRGPLPYLRVIMSLTQDNVKSLFLTRANVRTRQEIDARNSESR